MKVGQDVLTVLQHCETTGNSLRITEQLDRDLYVKLDKVLQAAGGKWNRKARVHLFDGGAADAIEQVMLTGEIAKPQDFGFFETPPALVDQLVALANIEPGMDLLEPEAGKGAIALRLLAQEPSRLTCFELLDKNVATLAGLLAASELSIDKTLIDIRQADFLSVMPWAAFNRVVMNPPFAKQADIAHIMHAYKFLARGGRLVSIASGSVAWRGNMLTRGFREFVESKRGSIMPLPEGSFKASGTMVNTAMVVIPR